MGTQPPVHTHIRRHSDYQSMHISADTVTHPQSLTQGQVGKEQVALQDITDLAFAFLSQLLAMESDISTGHCYVASQ